MANQIYRITSFQENINLIKDFEYKLQNQFEKKKSSEID